MLVDVDVYIKVNWYCNATDSVIYFTEMQDVYKSTENVNHTQNIIPCKLVLQLDMRQPDLYLA